MLFGIGSTKSFSFFLPTTSIDQANTKCYRTARSFLVGRQIHQGVRRRRRLPAKRNALY
jgi:hypothetical protein